MDERERRACRCELEEKETIAYAKNPSRPEQKSSADELA